MHTYGNIMKATRHSYNYTHATVRVFRTCGPIEADYHVYMGGRTLFGAPPRCRKSIPASCILMCNLTMQFLFCRRLNYYQCAYYVCFIYLMEANLRGFYWLGVA